MTDKALKIHTVQLHIGDLAGGTLHMDATEFGAYMSLILALYQIKGHMLDDDPKRLARMARCTGKVWGRISETVMEKFTLVEFPDGFRKWTHKRVLTDADSYSVKSAKNKINRSKGNDSNRPMVNQSSTNRLTTQDPRPKTQLRKEESKKESITHSGPSDPAELSPLAPGNGASVRMPFRVTFHLDENALNRAKANAPGWDIYHLAGIYDNSIMEGARSRPDNPNGAFPAWVKIYTKGKPP